METNNSRFAPETCHEHLVRTVELTLSYTPAQNYEHWRVSVSARLQELLGPTPAVVPLNVEPAEQ